MEPQPTYYLYQGENREQFEHRSNLQSWFPRPDDADHDQHRAAFVIQPGLSMPTHTHTRGSTLRGILRASPALHEADMPNPLNIQTSALH